MHSVKWASAILLSAVFFRAVAQKKEPLLEKQISITASNESASAVLARIAAQTGIRFSYSPTQIPADKKVSLKVVNKPLRTVLQLIFADAVQVKEKGHFIILTARPQPPPEAVTREITISGYVYDENGEKLAYASIVSKSEQTAAVTNQYGFYSIRVKASQLPSDLKVVKESYNDTFVKINPRQTQIDVVLSREQQPPATGTTMAEEDTTAAADTLIQVRVDSGSMDTAQAEPMDWLRKVMKEMALSDEDKANIRNLKDTLFSSIQLSVIPQLSTNRLLVGNTVNDASLSLLIAYSKGINIASFAGLMNYTAGDMSYAQAAGLVNATEGSVTGGQAAGLMNITEGAITGGQAAGLMNITDSSVTGGQAAGLMNITKGSVRGAQAAGLMNIVEGDMNGAQAAGLMNITEGYVKGAQVAGLVNLTEGSTEGATIGGLGNIVKGDWQGVQIGGVFNVIEGNGSGFRLAGLSNISDGFFHGAQIAGMGNISGGSISGLQLAALFNTCDSTIRGVQLAGIINDAGVVEGFQLAPINFARENNGISFGLFNFTARGYHKLELFGDDVMYTNLAFRTGVARFHNIFTAGVDLTSRISGLWCFGYGFGSFHALNDRWSLGADVIAQLYVQNDRVTKAPLVSHLFLGLERSFGRKFSMAFGPTYHLMTNFSGEQVIADLITPYSFHSRTFADGTDLRMWVGGKLSLRFF